MESKDDGQKEGTDLETGGDTIQVKDAESTPYLQLVAACQQANVKKISDLLESGTVKATDVGEDGITPLHWAAINNGIGACARLIDAGADVNAKGGELHATPIQWAARNGLIEAVHLLILRGADPCLCDTQGFNTLHLAVHSSNILLVVYVLELDIPVNSLDPHGRTPLHWAAYQGDALSVDVLLRFGASVTIVDQTGFTALHWAVVRGNYNTMKRLLQEGADVQALTNDNKSVLSLALEMKCIHVLEAALRVTGHLNNGAKRKFPISRKVMNGIIFSWPALMIASVLFLAHLTVWTFVPLALFTLASLFMILTNVIIPWGTVPEPLTRTPFIAGIFSGSCLLAIFEYIKVILPQTFSIYPFTNSLLILLFTLGVYTFYKCCTSDPGFIPKPTDLHHQKAMIDELIVKGAFDSRNFCVSCFVRKPLRSKHCDICNRCVAKFDHHCPWTANCIGFRTHRLFMVYIFVLAFGIPVFIFLANQALTQIQRPIDVIAKCSLLSGTWCQSYAANSFLAALTIWLGLQLIWIALLLIIQLYQISRAITNNESINLRRSGWMGDDGEYGSTSAQRHHQHRGGLKRLNAKCMRLLGVEQFIATAQQMSESARGKENSLGDPELGISRQNRNPFDHGIMSNCRDFWCINSGEISVGKPRFCGILNPSHHASLADRQVDYYRLYEVPSNQVNLPSVELEETQSDYQT